MRKVEATQERRDEPRGSITLVFHHGPESICLKIKRGRTPFRSALRLPRTAHITCDFHYPTCVSLCGKGAALCQTASHWFMPAERQRPKEGDSYRPMDFILIGKNERINCARFIFYILTFSLGFLFRAPLRSLNVLIMGERLASVTLQYYCLLSSPMLYNGHAEAELFIWAVELKRGQNIQNFHSEMTESFFLLFYKHSCYIS